MVACLFLQAIFITYSLRYYERLHSHKDRQTGLWNVTLLCMVMLLMLIGSLIQTAIWAALFRLLGEFDDFNTALYFSGVNFATLGYGDIVMSERWRLLGPLEAAHGVLMFGVSTAVLTTAVMDIIRDMKTKLGE